MAAARSATAVQTANVAAHTRADRTSAGTRGTAALCRRRQGTGATAPAGAPARHPPGPAPPLPPPPPPPALAPPPPPPSRGPGAAPGPHPLPARTPREGLRAEARGESRLRRALGPAQPTSLGVGAVIGAGIFVSTGAVARQTAGPALMVS